MHRNFKDLKNKNMTPREFRQEQEFEFDHFQELTNTGIKPNYLNIELFAHEYYKHKLKLLGIGGVSEQRELLKTFCDYIGVDQLVNSDDMIVDIEEHIRVFNFG